MKTLKFISAFLLFIGLFSFSGTPHPKSTKHICKGVKAKLCSDCGFGNKKDNCAKCNKWIASTKIEAQLCNDCGFGNKKDNCCKCGKWVASNGVQAMLCNDCGFGNKKDNCVKCNKWVGGS
jgi:ribosomal protein L37E